MPPTRALTNLKGVRTQIYAAPKAKPDILYIGLNDRDPQWHDLYELHHFDGRKEAAAQEHGADRRMGFRSRRQPALGGAHQPGGRYGDSARGCRTASSRSTAARCWKNAAWSDFDASNKQVYLITNKGALDLSELETAGSGDGDHHEVSRATRRSAWMSEAWRLSDVDYHIYFTQYEDDRHRLYFKDKAFEKEYHWLQSKLPGKEIGFGARSKDENIWIVNASSDYRAGRDLPVEPQGQDAGPAISHPRGDCRARRFRSASRITSSRRTGWRFRAYLTLPKGLPAKNLPLVVFPHGGPWARDYFGYDTFAQFLANRGYAVLQPNFRGSTGYGKKFLNAGNGEWGRKMQDDLTWGVKALVADGTVDAKRVGIFGGSYGGYATLAGVAFTPDVYAAAVAYVAPSNLITLLDAIPPYWEAGRKQMYARMADPTTPEGKALLVAESPLTQAKAIVTPLMVVQGKNDPRVNMRESNQIVAAVRDNGKPVEYLVAPDEGHGFARPINNLAMVTAMEQFLAKYLGGRVQKEVPADVAAKLKEITVDPKTVSGEVTLKGSVAPTPTQK